MFTANVTVRPPLVKWLCSFSTLVTLPRASPSVFTDYLPGHLIAQDLVRPCRVVASLPGEETLLDLNIEGEDFDTVGGFVYHQLGKIPVVGDEVQADGLRLRVLSVLGRRIKKIRVKKELPPPSNGNGSNQK